MGLLEKLKSFFGSGEERSVSGPDEPEITVEHEPAAESEHAVKGTGPADETGAVESAGETAAVDPADETGTAGTAGDASDVEETATPGGTDATVATESSAEADSTAGTATGSGETGVSEEPADSPPVEEIKGIGPTYSERLGDAGIGTVADLAAADPEAVAEAAETSRSRADGWIERARER